MKKSKLIPLFLLLLLTTLQGCIILPPHEIPSVTESSSVPPMQEEPTGNPILTYYKKVNYMYHADGIDETVLRTGLDSDYLLLMNKIYTLGEGYAPASLTTLTCPTHHDETLRLETRAALALYEMFAEMRHDGVTDIMVTSAYRTYAYQQQLFNYYLRREQETLSAEAVAYFGEAYIQKNYRDKGKTGLSAYDAERVVLSYSARPGTSEHQTGLCVDFITSDMDGLTEVFETKEAFTWLSENAYKFGFILRYPKGKESVTGYIYEPWHYRFVGREAATNIHFAGLTLEEYLEIAKN